jgi:hypothetical protein
MMKIKSTRAARRPGPFGDRGEFGVDGTFKADSRWRRWLAIIAATSALVAAGCGGSSGSKSASVGVPTPAGGAKAAASSKPSPKLPEKGCGLLSDTVVSALLGGSPTASSESRSPEGLPQGSVVGCTWMGAGGRQAGIVLHQSSSSARDFGDNTSGPGYQPVSGLGDQAMLHVATGQEEGAIEVLRGQADILVFGTLTASAGGYAATLKLAAAMILMHLGPS